MKKVKFLSDVSAVNCEKAVRVPVAKGQAYDLLSLEPARKPGDVIVNFVCPTTTHLGGDDGKTPLPCTLRVQVPEASVKVEGK